MIFQKRIRWLAALFACGGLRAEDAPDFAKEVRPILEKNCFECHGAKKEKGGLRPLRLCVSALKRQHCAGYGDS